MNVIKSHWVFKMKYWAEDTIELQKVRLIAKGYTQHEGIDFN